MDSNTKYNYFKYVLESKASYAIQNINLTSENCEYAIFILEKRSISQSSINNYS